MMPDIESVIEWLKDKDIIKTKNQEENARRELAELPSVTPKQKAGKWIDVNSLESSLWHACTECGETEFYATNYCPNCGAKMEVEE